jgi:hypothetical protein
MTPQEFKREYSQAAANERTWYQDHIGDLCDILGVPRPSAANRDDLDYSFERHVSKAGGGKGFADVWKHGHFGWE